jgi:hypothetical protein
MTSRETLGGIEQYIRIGETNPIEIENSIAAGVHAVLHWTSRLGINEDTLTVTQHTACVIAPFRFHASRNMEQYTGRTFLHTPEDFLKHRT